MDNDDDDAQSIETSKEMIEISKSAHITQQTQDSGTLFLYLLGLSTTFHPPFPISH